MIRDGPTEASISNRLAVLDRKRTKEYYRKLCSDAAKKRWNKSSEMPVERAESLIQPLEEDIRTDVRAEVEIPLTGLLQSVPNSGSFEDILGKIIEEAVYRGVRGL